MATKFNGVSKSGGVMIRSEKSSLQRSRKGERHAYRYHKEQKWSIKPKGLLLYFARKFPTWYARVRLFYYDLHWSNIAFVIHIGIYSIGIFSKCEEMIVNLRIAWLFFQLSC